MKTVSQIREGFLNFFEEKGHEICPSSPLIPHNDPSLLFTNAGMVPFKNVFTGAETLTNAEQQTVTKATSSQKCVRAGGKHNDLENVGYTARHHTFFEMLGNFSFGDYFKKDAISFAWEFLTNRLEIPREKLLVTVYHTDEEAFEIWHKITGWDEKRIIRIPTSDNFWAMGDTGPCGPCSEIFYDHGEHIPGGPPGSKDEDGDRFIEIWNLVFMQYEQLAAKKGEEAERIDLPKPSIDTGMGLERIAAVLQQKHDNYDIDLFKNLIEASKDISGNNDHDTSHRVIADHLRSSCFLLADGVMPSNEGRGYVLRRIMRRAMRHAHQLGCKDPLMYQLVPSLITEMGAAYPELPRAEALITESLKLEEERFKETLDKGIHLLETATDKLKEGDILDGKVAFKLYDTFGFPLDLTQDMLRAKNITVDTDMFAQEMAAQKERARAAWSGSGEESTGALWFTIRQDKGPSEFLGYESTEGQGNILAIVKDGKEVEKASKGDTVIVITNQTPFYGESGGQMGDHGTISTKDAVIDITDTKKPLGDLILHSGTVTKGSVTLGEELHMVVDVTRRNAVRANHSATHLLHAILRKHLGDHVTQKGSMVDAESFRFDFSHPKALTSEDITWIESELNRLIRDNSVVTTHLMAPDDAIAKGAMALFGEKYDDEVRVVSMGTEDYSVELCGGTHVTRTGDIGLFKITKESAVAAGVRRIEAVTAQAAFTHLSEKDHLVDQIAQTLKSSPEEVLTRITTLQQEKKQLEQAVKDARKASALGGGKANKDDTAIEQVGETAFVGKILENVPAGELKSVVDEVKRELGSGVAVIIATNEGKASIVVGVTEDLTDHVNAVDLVKIGSESLGGKGGGGRPDMAQAGGPDVTQTSAALENIKKALL